MTIHLSRSIDDIPFFSSQPMLHSFWPYIITLKQVLSNQMISDVGHSSISFVLVWIFLAILITWFAELVQLIEEKWKRCHGRPKGAPWFKSGTCSNLRENFNRQSVLRVSSSCENFGWHYRSSSHENLGLFFPWKFWPALIRAMITLCLVLLLSRQIMIGC